MWHLECLYWSLITKGHSGQRNCFAFTWTNRDNVAEEIAVLWFEPLLCFRGVWCEYFYLDLVKVKKTLEPYISSFFPTTNFKKATVMFLGHTTTQESTEKGTSRRVSTCLRTNRSDRIRRVADSPLTGKPLETRCEKIPASTLRRCEKLLTEQAVSIRSHRGGKGSGGETERQSRSQLKKRKVSVEKVSWSISTSYSCRESVKLPLAQCKRS